MNERADLLVIGGGVIGLTSAYFFAKEGHRVELVDRGALGAEASWAGAGIIPPGNPELAQHPYDRLRAWGAVLHASLAAELSETVGIDNGYRRCGGIEFIPPKESEAITKAWRQESIDFAWVDRTACSRFQSGLEPPLRPGYFLPGMAQVRNPWHIRALVAACQRVGVKLRCDSTVTEIERSANRVQLIELAGGTKISAGSYLFATGAWTDQLTASFGLQMGIVPVRGQIVLLHAPEAKLQRILLDGKRYIVPRDDGRVLIGSTEEPEAGFHKSTTPEGTAGLLAFARKLVPALASVEPERSWAGLRPGSPDGMPFLGRIPGYENAFVAAGHFRAGVQLSPSTALVMTDIIARRLPRFPIEPLRPDRPVVEGFVPAFRS